MARIAVAVVSWNTRDLLERCLESLRPSAESGDAEVWVVDNGSSDGSAGAVRRRFGWVELIESAENLGFGPAVNLVAERTRSEWVAAANADVALAPDALATLLRAGERHSEAGVLAPRLRLPDGTTQHSVHPFPTLPTALLVSLGIAAVPPVGRRLAYERRWDSDRPREVDWAHGAFLLVRRSAWDAAGGFPPEQWMYAEDLDLCWRVSRAGWRVRYVPDALVEHEAGAATVQRWGDDRLAACQRSAYAWMLRRRGLARTRLYAAINLAGAAVRWVALRILARLRPGRYAARRDAMRAWVRAHRAGLAPADELRAHR